MAARALRRSLPAKVPVMAGRLKPPRKLRNRKQIRNQNRSRDPVPPHPTIPTKAPRREKSNARTLGRASRLQLQFESAEILAKTAAQLGIFQCEFDGRLQKSLFVTCIVRAAVVDAREKPVIGGEAPQAVGQLNFTTCAGLSLF